MWAKFTGQIPKKKIHGKENSTMSNLLSKINKRAITIILFSLFLVAQGQPTFAQQRTPKMVLDKDFRFTKQIIDSVIIRVDTIPLLISLKSHAGKPAAKAPIQFTWLSDSIKLFTNSRGEAKFIVTKEKTTNLKMSVPEGLKVSIHSAMDTIQIKSK